MSTYVDKPLKSVMYGQCDARPTVTFPSAGHYCPVTGTRHYTVSWQRHVCLNNLPKVVTWKREAESQAHNQRKSNALTITPLDYTRQHEPPTITFCWLNWTLIEYFTTNQGHCSSCQSQKATATDKRPCSSADTVHRHLTVATTQSISRRKTRQLFL